MQATGSQNQRVEEDSHRSTERWFARLAVLGIGATAAWFLTDQRTRGTQTDDGEFGQDDPFADYDFNSNDDCYTVGIVTGNGEGVFVEKCLPDDGGSGGGESDDCFDIKFETESGSEVTAHVCL